MDRQRRAALLAKTAKPAAERFEFYKTTATFDGTAQIPSGWAEARAPRHTVAPRCGCALRNTMDLADRINPAARPYTWNGTARAT